MKTPKGFKLVGRHVSAVGGDGYKRTMYLYAAVVGDKWEILMRCETRWPRRFGGQVDDEIGLVRAKWTKLPKWLKEAIGGSVSAL
jgi:hypothetical protein